MSDNAPQAPITFRLTGVRGGQHDCDSDERSPFTEQDLIASVPGFPDSVLKMVTYHPGKDRFSAFETWDNSEYGLLDSLAVFNPRSCRGEAYSDVGLSDLGYTGVPAQVVLLVRITVGVGLVERAMPAVLIRKALRSISPASLVIAEFGGAEFNPEKGNPTARGYALQMGFDTASSRVLALAKDQLELWRNPATPWPKFYGRAPRAKKPTEAPTFEGAIFPRQFTSWGASGHAMTLEGRTLRSSENIDRESELLRMLKDGIAAKNLVHRGADNRCTVLTSGESEATPRLALGNDLFEVGLALDCHTVRPHPWMVHQRLSDFLYDWLGFLLAHGNVSAALDAYARVSVVRVDNKFDIGSTTKVDSWRECPAQDGSHKGLLTATVNERETCFVRVGTAPDGIRPLVMGVASGGAVYLGLTTRLTSIWTAKCAQEHHQAIDAAQRSVLAKAKKKKSRGNL